ncbi:MAG: cation diffusion facilitator family transporter [Syntrophobacteraceae bacterium]
MAPQSKETHLLKSRLIPISLSLVIGAALMGIKFYVYWITGSSAVLSDALESIINVVASAFAMWSIILASRPPDPSHPYGHGKVEYFSAGFEGALIVLAALGIFYKAGPEMLNPHELPELSIGLLILLGASVVNLLLGLGLVAAGKKTHSLVLVADGKHILTDVYTSAGVLLGLVLVKWTQWYWLDGATACLVALNILVVGSKLMRQSIAGLMDASDPELLEDISRFFRENRRNTWIDIHRLRAWRAGNMLYVDFHVILPRDFTLETAHEEVTAISKMLGEHLGESTDVLIHAEPCIDPECPICAYDPCKLRRELMSRRHPWNSDDLVSYSDEKLRSNGCKEKLNPEEIKSST